MRVITEQNNIFTAELRELEAVIRMSHLKWPFEDVAETDCIRLFVLLRLHSVCE